MSIPASIRPLIHSITPPVIVDAFRSIRAYFQPKPRPMIEWEYLPEGWAYAEMHPEVKGWNVVDVLEIYREKWPRFVEMVQGSKPLGVAHESNLTTGEDVVAHNVMMAFAYALTISAKHKDRFSMLDWGGGIGHYYLLAQALLPEVEIEYHCKDVPVFCEYGSQLFPQQHFHTDEDCFDLVYDFVVASGSMHYTKDWKMLLQCLANATSGYLYIASMPIVTQAPSFVFVQRPYQYGYNTEYLAWCLNQTEFLHIAEKSGLRLLREFIYGHQPFIQGAPEQNTYRGYLFDIHPGRKHAPER